MRKILIVTPVFWPEAFRVNDLALAWIERGYEVEVLAGHPNYPEGSYFEGYAWHGPWREQWGKIRILRFPQFPRGQGQAWRLALQYASFVVFGSFRVLIRRAWDWDRIFVFQTTPVTAALPALLATRLSGAKSVIWVQDLWPDSLQAVGMRFPDLIQRGIRAMSSAIYCSFTKVVGQSQAFLPRLQELGVEKGRLHCVYQWADEGAPPPPGSITPAWAPGFTVLFAGNLGRAQGLASVLEAADLSREIPGLQWVLMGDGSLRPWLLEEVKRRGLQDRLILPGRRPPEEMPFHFAAADVLLISLGDDSVLARTVPSKLSSYLAAGRPVLGAVAGEPARVIQASGAGMAVPPEDPRALASAVIAMRGLSPEALKAMACRGQAYYAEHFTKAACMAQLEALLLGEDA
jgi:colanic acid biosynthesis glycosyl transferase WcaI